MPMKEGLLMADYNENKYTNILTGLFLLALLIFIMSLQGCASSLEAMKDDRFKIGCAVVDVQAKIGMFNQEGTAEACKLVCSEKLPSGLTYEYESRGCHVSIGQKNVNR